MKRVAQNCYWQLTFVYEFVALLCAVTRPHQLSTLSERQVWMDDEVLVDGSNVGVTSHFGASRFKALNRANSVFTAQR